MLSFSRIVALSCAALVAQWGMGLAASSALATSIEKRPADCVSKVYKTYSISDTEQTLQLDLCDGSATMTLISSPDQSKAIGLQTGHVLFSGLLNEEIPGIEGTLHFADRCGLQKIDSAAVFSDFWTSEELSAEIRIPFTPQSYSPSCEKQGNAMFAAELILGRVDGSGGNSSGAEVPVLPREGCEAYAMTQGNTEQARMTLCLDGGAFKAELLQLRTGDALQQVEAGYEYMRGYVQGIDGAIVGTLQAFGPDSCGAAGYRVTGSTNEGGTDSAFYLEGHKPIFDPDCGVSSYQAVRYRLAPVQP